MVGGVLRALRGAVDTARDLAGRTLLVFDRRADRGGGRADAADGADNLADGGDGARRRLLYLGAAIQRSKPLAGSGRECG
jgi:hypothetical protein